MAKGISAKKLNEIKVLNKKISQKKSRIKSRYDVTVDIPRIDTSLRGKALQEAISEAKSFLNPANQKYQYKKNEQGVVFTKSEITKTKLMVDRINRIKAKALKEINEQDFTIEGRVIGKVKDAKIASARNMDEKFKFKFNIDMFRDRKHFDVWLAGKDKTYAGDFVKRNRHQYRANYISALREAFGDASDVEQLVGLIQGMDLDEFYRTSMSADERSIEFIYESSKRDGVLQSIGESWGIDLGLEAV